MFFVFLLPNRVFYIPRYDIIDAMDEKNNFGQQQWQVSQNQNTDTTRSQFLGTGEGEVPLAKMPSDKIDVRTMASDVTSMQETGGGMPRPYTPQTQTTAPKETTARPTPISPSQSPINFVDQMVGGIGQAGQQTSTTPQPKKTGGGRSLFGTLLIVIIVVGLIVIGYFFVYPQFINTGTEKDQGVATTTPPTLPEETANVPPIPAPETATTSPVVPPTAPVSTVEVHASFFKTKADLVVDAKLSAFTLEDLKKPIAFETTSVPLFKEIVWKTQENKPLSFSQIASLIFPNFFTTEKVANFEDDFTLFAYSNTKGTWLGFVVKLKDGVDIGAIQNSMSTLQKDIGLKNLFLSDPGTMNPWKDGKVRNKPTSLAPFSLQGATISYTWFDRYLLVSSNLEAAEEAGKRLGY